MAEPLPRGVASAGTVLDLIRSGRAATRADVARLTGLSRTAVAARLAALRELDLVVEDAVGPSSGGRPPARLRFNRHAGVVLAAAIGRSRTQLAVCDLLGDVLTSADLEQEVGAGPDEVMPRVVKELQGLLAEAARGPEAVRGFGCSIPGTVDTTTGASLDSPVMHGWDGVPLPPHLHRLVRAPVHVENDATVLALSERHGALEAHRDLLVLKASTGIGAGLVVDGRIVRGSRGAAGEVGHIKTAAARGRPCRCGDNGCLESVAAGWALVQEMRSRGREVGHVRDLVRLAVAGDPDARQLVRDSGRRTGEVLAGAVNLLNPAALVVGGDMQPAYDFFVAGMRETLYAGASALASQELQIQPATHGDRAGVVGCAALVLEHVLDAAAVDLMTA